MTMSNVVVIGEEMAVRGYALAGVRVLPAPDAESVRAAFDGLDDSVAVVILTEAAAACLPDEVSADLPLTVVLPP